MQGSGKQGTGIGEQGTGSGASVLPVRGTQSFVGVMVEVFRRPSLTGLEVLWRWVFWVAILATPVWRMRNAFALVLPGTRPGGIGGTAFGFSPEVLRSVGWAGWLALAAAVPVWVVLSAIGRQALLRRIRSPGRPKVFAQVGLGVLRWLWWAFIVGLWFGMLALAAQGLVFKAMARGGEPSWVPFCAVVIPGTLLLFVVWLATSWVFPLASLYAADSGATAATSLRKAAQKGPLAGKVMEINLVMGIVKIALIVLAMVLSACPLPFEAVETQSFLITWTAGVLLLYFVASDYFHAVRLVAFLRMMQVLAPDLAAARAGGSAS